MSTYPDDTIVNPHADPAETRRAYRAGYAPVVASTMLLVTAVLFVAYTLIFPVMKTVVVSSQDIISESGDTYREEVTAVMFSFEPTVFASASVLLSLIALITFRGSLAKRLQRRHPGMFVTASTLDGYITDEEPDRKSMWDAAQLEREARIVDARIAQARKAPGLTSAQHKTLLRDETERDSARALAAETLNRDSHDPHAADL